MTGLSEFMARVAEAVGAFEMLLASLCFVVAFALTIGAVLLLRSDNFIAGGRERPAAFAMLIVAAFLFALPEFIAMAGMSLWGEETPASSEIFAYAPEMLGVFDQDTSRTILTSLLRVVQFIGAVAIFRALLLFNRAPNNPGAGLYGRAVTHLVGGTLAWNIVLFLGTIESVVIGAP